MKIFIIFILDDIFRFNNLLNRLREALKGEFENYKYSILSSIWIRMTPNDLDNIYKFIEKQIAFIENKSFVALNILLNEHLKENCICDIGNYKVTYQVWDAGIWYETNRKMSFTVSNKYFKNRFLFLPDIYFETEKNYYKKQIEKNISLYKRIKKYNNEDELLKLLKDGIKYYKSELTIKRPYLLKNVSENIILMFEEFLLGDLEVEDTQLFKRIESVKNNIDYSESFYSLIDQLEDRRKRNQYLKNIPTFTVWKILDYVRNKYSCNKIVLYALDKYYNLDRFTIANDDCEYGYIIPESIEMSDYPDSSLYVGCIDSMVISTYKGNEFEREDSYFNYNFEEKFEYDSEEYPSKFAYDLAKCEFVKNKKDVLKLSYKCRAKTINE